MRTTTSSQKRLQKNLECDNIFMKKNYITSTKNISFADIKAEQARLGDIECQLFILSIVEFLNTPANNDVQFIKYKQVAHDRFIMGVHFKDEHPKPLSDYINYNAQSPVINDKLTRNILKIPAEITKDNVNSLMDVFFGNNLVNYERDILAKSIRSAKNIKQKTKMKI